MKTECNGCCREDECPCVKECDESYCEKHHAEQWDHWKKYFNSYGENARLMVMSDAQLAAEQEFARRLK